MIEPHIYKPGVQWLSVDTYGAGGIILYAELQTGESYG